MKYILALNSRTSVEDNLEWRHLDFVKQLHGLSGALGLRVDALLPMPKFSSNVFASISLRGKLGRGVKGNVFYRYRRLLEDHHSCDDRIWVEFDSATVSIDYILNEALNVYVRALPAYHIEIYPEGLTTNQQLIPFEIRSAINFRNNLIRIPPVLYMDHQMTWDVFQKTAGEVLELIVTEYPQSRSTEQGLILTCGELPGRDDAERFHGHILRLLNIELPVTTNLTVRFY
jgi:hypothetical protein